jgi:hypothetical protein
MVEYLLLKNEVELPDISNLRPYRAVVVIEKQVSQEWQNKISDWLVQTGCLFMMAWGIKCSTWDDSVDWALLDEFNFKEIPEESNIMTSWHEDESLEEVFSFAKKCVHDNGSPDVVLKDTLILHIGDSNREDQFKEMFNDA